MALKRLIAKLEDVAEGFRSEYKPAADGNGFVLDTDDKDYKAKLDKFDADKKALTTQLEELKGKLSEYGDPEEFKALRELAQRLDADEDGKLIKEGKHEKVWEKRRTELQKEFDKRLKAEQVRAEKAEARAAKVLPKLKSLTLDTSMSKLLGTVGALRGESAKVDALLRASQVFDVNEDGELVLREGVDLMGKDGTKAITPQEWVEKLVDDAPHLWEPSSGSGTKGGAAKPAAGSARVSHADPFEMGRRAKDIVDNKVTVV